MPVRTDEYLRISNELKNKATLVAVSKTRSIEEIMQLYELGHRDFGENYVQELVEKHFLLPHDIRWHFIGHLQSNKVKYIAPFVHLVHGVDSYKLLLELNRQAARFKHRINCLLQVHIAMEETKYGLNDTELEELVEAIQRSSGSGELEHVKVRGLMGMASFTDDGLEVRKEFKYLKGLYDLYSNVECPSCKFTTLSMGMSSDYRLALEEGTNMVRIGSAFFGPRETKL